MTATLAISVVEEKGGPEPTTKTIPEPARKRSILVDYILQFYEKYFQTRCDRLKLCQIILGFAAVSLVCYEHYYQYTSFANCLVFLGVNIPLLTAAQLWDSHNGNRLRTLLRLDRIFDNLELHFHGVAAALYYFAAFGLLAAYYVGDFFYVQRIEAGLCGILASVAHGYHWWVLFRRDERSSEEEPVVEGVRPVEEVRPTVTAGSYSFVREV